MSYDFFKKYGNDYTPQDLREWCKRPGKTDENGNPLYTTEQSHKDRCDAKKIISKYHRTGVVTHMSKMEAKFGNLTGMDFKEAMDLLTESREMFDELPSEIRKYFQNSPMELFKFMEDPGNRDKAIELGLIRKEWTPETDGLGEHVKEGENVEIE